MSDGFIQIMCQRLSEVALHIYFWPRIDLKKYCKMAAEVLMARYAYKYLLCTSSLGFGSLARKLCRHWWYLIYDLYNSNNTLLEFKCNFIWFWSNCDLYFSFLFSCYFSSNQNGKGSPSKLYIPSTLNIDLILWHTQLIVCA